MLTDNISCESILSCQTIRLFLVTGSWTIYPFLVCKSIKFGANQPNRFVVVVNYVYLLITITIIICHKKLHLLLV